MRLTAGGVEHSQARLAGPGESVLAVLVLYQRPLAHSATFQSLRAIAGNLSSPLPLLVYDNSPTPVGHPDGGPYPGLDIHYVHDPTNPGVSRAYVAGARIALQRSSRWLWLLDQDTRFPPDALDRYMAAMRRHPHVRLFAPVLTSGGRILSPCRYRLKLGFPLPRVESGPRSLKGVSVLNSGMYVALEEYLAAGGHDVRIALDFADHEFIERFKRRHKTFVVVDTVCAHDFFRLTGRSTATHLTRFQFYCRGARQSSKSLVESLNAAGVIGARACVLALRHRSPRFLGVAARTLLEREPG